MPGWDPIRMESLRGWHAFYPIRGGEFAGLAVALHQQQLSDILANKPDIVTESVWRNRLSYAVTFLPRLPVYVSPEDLSVLFGGIEVQFKSPYVPPAESTIQVKWQLFQKMPEKEKETITLLCREMAANYRIEFHPIVRLLEG